MAGAVLAAMSVAGAGVTLALRRPLPRTKGQVKLTGLTAPVEVVRDHWGIPHIYARTNHDLFVAQGYVHAQDRLWQMELNRRLGAGRLSELFGPIALDSDRFVRTLGFNRIVNTEMTLLNRTTHDMLTAYVAGINQFLDHNRSRLPIEFTLLRHRPEPWRAEDALLWIKMMALNLGENWTGEILRAQIVAAVGPERAAQLEHFYPEQHPVTVPYGITYPPLANHSEPLNNGLFGTLGGATGQGSNAWVVDGTRTTSGKPLLADDPHLAISMPSIWYENHLHGGDFHVTGASFPGCPGVVIGHNEQIAWGVTNVMADVQDLYLERFDPQNPEQYEYQGQWHACQIVREEIQIKGQREVHLEEIRITRHGPVISAFLKPQTNSTHLNPLATNEAYALRWTALEPNAMCNALSGLNLAQNWQSFRDTLGDWYSPPQNFVYADREGNIGYSVGGRIPLRRNHDGRLPVPGWVDTYEWDGAIPNLELPHRLNPPNGYLVTANHRVVDDQYPYPFSGEWLNGYRAMRISELIEETTRHSFATFQAMQIDRRSLPGLELVALAGRLPANDSFALQVRTTLQQWDGDLLPDSVGGLIFSRLSDQLLLAAYREIEAPLKIKLGMGAFASLPINSFLNRALPQTLERLRQRDNAWLANGQTWDSLFESAWEATLNELRTEFGPNLSSWSYRQAHSFTMNHPLGGVPGLARLFNRGPLAVGGDQDTVAQGHKPRYVASLPVYIAPSYRQIIDLADWDNCRSIHATGQSGQPASHHYDDFVAAWCNGDYHPMLWSRTKIDEVAKARLMLVPDA
jgi:penicillin amidase